MEKSRKEMTAKGEESLFKLAMFRYFPYWPLYVLLIVICGIGAWIYLRYATPVYEVTANVLLKDEKKGADDSPILEALQIYSSKKIVENEIEVFKSRVLMQEVVQNLHLYAPVFEEGQIKPKTAYASSPIYVQVQNPEKIIEQEKISFSYNKAKNEITIGESHYPLNQWVKTIYGVLKFAPNENETLEPIKPLYFSLIPPKKATYLLLYGLEVTATNKLASIINLKINDEVPQRGEAILNELIKAYERASLNDKNTLAINTLAFIDDRISNVVGELDSIERKVQQYKSGKGIINLSEQGKLFLQNVGDNDRKLTDVDMQLSVLNQVENYVVTKDKKIGIVPSTLGVSDPVLSQLLQKLYEAELQYEKLKKTTDIGNPMMISLSNEIENIRPSVLENIRGQRRSLLASKGNLNMANGTYNSMMQSIPQKERELIDISRQQGIKNDVYSFLLHKREETALSYAATVSDSRIIDSAAASIEPVGPKKKLVYLASFILAIGLGVAFVSSKEFLTNKILFRSEIESMTGIPVVGEIGKAGSNKTLVINNPKKVFIAEQFRQLRTAIGIYGKNIKKNILLVTSGITGEGKSFISNNLALSLALSGKKVVILDMDLRQAKTSEMHGFSNRQGIAEFLEGRCELSDVIYSTAYNNLFVVPAGRTNINPTELLIYKDLGGLIACLEREFECIVIDAAPIDPVSDAFVLSQYCSTTLFVIRHNYTPKAMVQMLDENNKIKAFKNLAIVFNGIKARGFFKKGYGFGSGYGYTNIYGDKVYNAKKTEENI